MEAISQIRGDASVTAASVIVGLGRDFRPRMSGASATRDREMRHRKPARFSHRFQAQVMVMVMVMMVMVVLVVHFRDSFVDLNGGRQRTSRHELREETVKGYRLGA